MKDVPIARQPVDPFALTFVKIFALVPALLATIFAIVVGQRLPVGGAAPLVVLSGLGIVILAGGTTVALRSVCTLLFGASFFFFAVVFLVRFARARREGSLLRGTAHRDDADPRSQEVRA